MGWSFGWASKEELVAYLLQQWEDGEKTVTVSDHALVGSNLWTVQRFEDKATGEATLVLSLCKLKKQGGWGYKGMPESHAPVELDCPQRLLDAVPCPNDQWAIDWRTKVVEYHAKRKERGSRTLAIGQRYSLPGRTIPEVTISSLDPLRGTYKGTVYRVTKGMLGDEISA